MSQRHRLGRLGSSGNNFVWASLGLPTICAPRSPPFNGVLDPGMLNASSNLDVDVFQLLDCSGDVIHSINNIDCAQNIRPLGLSQNQLQL